VDLFALPDVKANRKVFTGAAGDGRVVVGLTLHIGFFFIIWSLIFGLF
jgi:hypothetical protein